MARQILDKKITGFLRRKEFINVGTCDFDGRPNVAPKFLLKVEDEMIYLVDYVIGRTLKNLKKNPRVSMSTVNIDTLTGYQINGQAQILSKGAEYDKLGQEYRSRQIDFSVFRIIDGVRKQEKHKNVEITFPEKVIFFKVEVNEIVEIIPSGKLKRRKVDSK